MKTIGENISPTVFMGRPHKAGDDDGLIQPEPKRL
jgi:hypothetical protein